MKQPSSGGGLQAITYMLGAARQAGPLALWKSMHSHNACKTCALGMGGQGGGMRNELGHYPEVCKKSLQAMAADMRGKLDPAIFENYSIAQFRTFSPREMEMLGRLTMPVVAEAGATHFRTLEWDAAMEMLSDGLRATDPRRAFFYASGRSSNEAGFLLQLFARIFGTNNVNNCSYYCHQASGVGLADSIGSSTASVTLEDVEASDLYVLIGANPPSNHPRLMTSLMRLRNRGGQVIVINPVRETGLVQFRVPSSVRSMVFGTDIASLYLQPAIGGDIALLTGVCKLLLESGNFDRAFIDAATEGFADLEAHIRAVDWKQIEAGCGLGRSQLQPMHDLIVNSAKTIFGWTMGITHHEHGTANVHWIVNLALLRGMVGRPGAGVMPIRGHSNVQGMGSVGVTPAVKKAVFEGLAAAGVKVPALSGLDTMACMEAAGRGEMDFALCLGGNLYGSNPDSAFAASAMARIGTVCYLSTSLNTGHARGQGKRTLILPVRARDEESQPTTQESMFSFVRLSDGGPERYPGARGEVAVLAELARRTLGQGGPIDWTLAENHGHIRKLIAQVVPGLEQLADIDQTKNEFAIPGRQINERRFPTASGKARFRPEPIPLLPPLGPGEVRLMTVRSEGQFNTVVYEETDIYRGQERRDVILMNAQDMQQMGFKPDQPIRVKNATGVMERILVRPFDIVCGAALMYYPEANVLVPRGVDQRSKTPAFKSVIVKLEA